MSSPIWQLLLAVPAPAANPVAQGRAALTQATERAVGPLSRF